MAILSDSLRYSLSSSLPRSPELASIAHFPTPWGWRRRQASFRIIFASGCASPSTPSSFFPEAKDPCATLSSPFSEIVLFAEDQNRGDRNSSLLHPPGLQFQDPRPILHSGVDCDERVLLLSDFARVLPASEPVSSERSSSEDGQAALFLGQNGSILKTQNGAISRRDRTSEEIPILEENDELWLEMRAEARKDAEREPVLASYLFSTVLAHRSLERALAFHLGNKLCSTTLLSTQLYTLFVDTYMGDVDIRKAVRADIMAVKERDPACISYSHCMLNFKGFLACEAYRIAHRLWKQGREGLALALQSRVSEVFAVDIHPAAELGKGLLLDHATGVVIGETAVVGDNVSILHGVTLGGTGKHGGDRHPKIGNGVLIGAGASILGNVKVGEGAKVGAGSLVLKDVPPRTTAVGSPARLVGGKSTPSQIEEAPPAITMDHTISNWSDYVI